MIIVIKIILQCIFFFYAQKHIIHLTEIKNFIIILLKSSIENFETKAEI